MRANPGDGGVNRQFVRVVRDLKWKGAINSPLPNPSAVPDIVSEPGEPER